MARLFKWVLLVVLTCLCFTGSAFAQDAVQARADFLASNPNNGWTFGCLDKDGNFIAYNTTFKVDENIVGWCLNGTPGILGDVTINFSENAIEKFGIKWEPGQICINPGFGCQGVVIRWSAPASGSLKISGKCKALIQAGGKTSVQISKNTSVFDRDEIAGEGFIEPVKEMTADNTEVLSAATSNLPFSSELSGNITVVKGDNIDFVFTKESELGSHVGIDLQITSATSSGTVSYNLNPSVFSASKVATAKLVKESTK